jgi:hypothetical protein
MHNFHRQIMGRCQAEKRPIHLFILLALTLLTAACQSTATPIVIIDTPTEEAAAIPACEHFEGATLQMRRVGDDQVRLQVGGLQPGEHPSVIYTTTATEVAASKVEMFDVAEGADASGDFSIVLSGLRPLGEESVTWDVRLIHERGVECATITIVGNSPKT